MAKTSLGIVLNARFCWQYLDTTILVHVLRVDLLVELREELLSVNTLGLLVPV
jgi:hypothetical protein